MKTLGGYSVSFILENSLIVLNSLLNDQSALDLLAEFKQTRETLENGLNMHTNAQELESRQIMLHSEMRNLKIQFDDCFKIARAAFKDYSSVIMVEFENDMDPKLKELYGLVQEENKQIEWLKKAKEFYIYVIHSKKIIDRIDKFNFTKEKMELVLQTVTDAEAARSQYNIAKGNAQELIRQRNTAVFNLSFWMKKLTRVAAVAFKPNPQYLEKCNILVLSDGYKRPKKESTAPTPEPLPAPTAVSASALTSAGPESMLQPAPSQKN